MIDAPIIKSINEVIETFFNEDKTVTIVPAKKLMPAFIQAGIFRKDIKNGKPIRDILKELDKASQLDLIPYIHAERKDPDTFWYFIPKNTEAPTTFYKQEKISVKKESANQARLLSDETYVIDLCDQVLGHKAERQKRFDFLLGDFHKDGRSRTKLPVDAFYAGYSLVIMYKESQQFVSLSSADNGAKRDEQRAVYDQRRATELPKHDIKLIEISFDKFKFDAKCKIVRNPESDVLIVKNILKAVM